MTAISSKATAQGEYEAEDGSMVASLTHRICCGLLTGKSSKAWGLLNLDVVAVPLISLEALPGVGFFQLQRIPKGPPPSLPLPPQVA